MRVVRAGSRHPIQAGDGLQVVVENIRRGFRQRVQRLRHPSPKVGDEDFHAHAGGGFSQSGNAFGEVSGAAVAEVVAIHAGDDDMRQAEFGDGAGEVLRLRRVGRVRASVGDIAERTAAGAEVAENHKGRRSLSETLADVGAGRFFANGMQVVFAEEALDFGEAGVVGGAGANPRGLARFGVGDGDNPNGIARGFVKAALVGCGDGSRFHYKGNLSQTASAMVAPRSLRMASEVSETPKSERLRTGRFSQPQGLMSAKGERSAWQLRETPW